MAQGLIAANQQPAKGTLAKPSPRRVSGKDTEAQGKLLTLPKVATGDQAPPSLLGL
jgi:hypothetical protein